MIPTAKEFWKKIMENNLSDEGAAVMIMFARHHVTEAIKECHKIALQEGLITEAGIGYFENAYNLRLIK